MNSSISHTLLKVRWVKLMLSDLIFALSHLILTLSHSLFTFSHSLFTLAHFTLTLCHSLLIPSHFIPTLPSLILILSRLIPTFPLYILSVGYSFFPFDTYFVLVDLFVMLTVPPNFPAFHSNSSPFNATSTPIDAIFSSFWCLYPFSPLSFNRSHIQMNQTCAVNSFDIHTNS